MMGVAEHKKKEVAVLEKKARKQEYYDRQKFNWGVNKQNNSQKHWRVSHPLTPKVRSETNNIIGSSSAVDVQPWYLVSFATCYELDMGMLELEPGV